MIATDSPGRHFQIFNFEKKKKIKIEFKVKSAQQEKHLKAPFSYEQTLCSKNYINFFFIICVNFFSPFVFCGVCLLAIAGIGGDDDLKLAVTSPSP